MRRVPLRADRLGSGLGVGPALHPDHDDWRRRLRLGPGGPSRRRAGRIALPARMHRLTRARTSGPPGHWRWACSGPARDQSVTLWAAAGH